MQKGTSKVFQTGFGLTLTGASLLGHAFSCCGGQVVSAVKAAGVDGGKLTGAGSRACWRHGA